MSLGMGLAVAVGGGLLLHKFFFRGAKRTVDGLADLAAFTAEEILSQSAEGFTVFLGRFSWQPAGERALVKVNPKRADVAAIISSLELKLSSYSGAEYAYYSGSPGLLGTLLKRHLRPGFALEVIAPASEKQIARSRAQPGVFIIETPSVYREVVEPHISSMDPASTAWIYKCLDLSKERERVLYNDTDPSTGFLLNVDTKWKSHPTCTEDLAARASWRGHESVKDLYCLAICHRCDLRSLRDLNATHLPLLRRILTQGTATVCTTYGVLPSDLRIFVHYQPREWPLLLPGPLFPSRDPLPFLDPSSLALPPPNATQRAR